MTANLDRLLAIMARLRDPKTGCPWDVEQSFATIAPYTIEEAYEVADAIERDDMEALREELGDLLLQVVFHARMAEEAHTFAFDDVAAAIADKMVRRHPHVFEDADGSDLRASWEAQKADERARKAARQGRAVGILDDVPRALPALTRAEKLQKRAARVGFDWPDLAPVLAKIDEELGELRAEIASGAPQGRLEDELGDLLFQVVFYAQISAEDGGFDFQDVARRIATKMRDRHPHVFGEAEERTSEGQTVAWEVRKAEERESRAAKSGRKPSVLDGVALALPALMRAQKLQKRAAREGFDWPDLGPVVAKIREELEELEAEIAAGAPEARLRDEAGDLLFACVNLARHIGVDAEVALRGTNAKFERRFRFVEQSLSATGRTPGESDLDEMDALWNEAKSAEKAAE